MKPTVFGAGYSVYVRIVRLALEEKDIAYDLVPVDAFATGGPGADYLARHPFGRIPAFEHDGFKLYETGAIARYIDEAFDGFGLQPADIKARARMNQVIGIADSYAYRAMVWDVMVERVNKPARGEISDEARIAAALARSKTCLQALVDVMGDGAWICGSGLTLADLWMAAILDYFLMTDEGRALFEEYPGLETWWSRMRLRPSMMATVYPA